MECNLNKSLFIWLTVMLSLLLMVIGNTAILIHKMNTLDKQYYQAGKSGYQMLYHVEQMEKLVADMETEERGYLLTGDRSYLGQFEETQKQIADHYQSLKLIMPEGTPILGRLQEVHQNINYWVDQAALPQISFWQQTYSRQDYSHITFNYLNDKEKDLIARCTSSIVQLEGIIQEQQNLENENISQLHSRVLLQIYLLTGILLLFVLIVGILAYFQKEQVQHVNDTLTIQDKKLKMAVKELQEISEHKSQFLANMSHELRTPLNSVIGFGQVLQKQFYGPLTDTQSRYVTYILNSGKHLLEMINDILDLSKVEAGKMNLEPSRFLLRTLLDNSILMVKEKAVRHHLELSLNISEEIQQITADERKLKQIVFNLLSNAVKFTPDGGKIQVNARLLLMHQEKYIEIRVADTGIGIPPSQQDRIFEPFTQLDGTYTRKNDGTGLGLSLVKKLVELHGGSVRVESEGEGKGSAFYCILPIKEGDEESKK